MPAVPAYTCGGDCCAKPVKVVLKRNRLIVTPRYRPLYIISFSLPFQLLHVKARLARSHSRGQRCTANNICTVLARNGVALHPGICTALSAQTEARCPSCVAVTGRKKIRNKGGSVAKITPISTNRRPDARRHSSDSGPCER